jgi:hypothetical protein
MDTRQHHPSPSPRCGTIIRTIKLPESAGAPETVEVNLRTQQNENSDDQSHTAVLPLSQHWERGLGSERMRREGPRPACLSPPTAVHS